MPFVDDWYWWPLFSYCPWNCLGRLIHGKENIVDSARRWQFQSVAIEYILSMILNGTKYLGGNFVLLLVVIAMVVMPGVLAIHNLRC